MYKMKQESMLYRGRLLSILLLIFIFLASCKQDRVPEQEINLEGKWNIYEAYRNNELTNTLQEGYFMFKDSLMETNILGEEISGTYFLEENVITHTSVLQADYKVVNYATDSMELTTTIQGFDFRFKIEKDSLSVE